MLRAMGGHRQRRSNREMGARAEVPWPSAARWISRGTSGIRGAVVDRHWPLKLASRASTSRLPMPRSAAIAANACGRGLVLPVSQA